MQATRFGPFELHPVERRLLRDGELVHLGSRAFDVLQELVNGRGRLLGKNELLDRVWPGLVVEEANVQVQVSALRKALGPHVVATIPGLGYRLAMSVDGEAARAPAAAPALAGSPWPCALAPLIGRESDLAAVQHLLERHRLVTLFGPGGMGKTRLALAAAAAWQQARGAGAWVDLSVVRSGTQLTWAVAQATGLALDAAGSEDSLLRALQRHDRLLVLDNCEHLLDVVAPLLGRLLAQAPGLRVLATSRAALQLPGEQLHPLAAMDLPAPRATLAQARRCGALQLLEQRAQAVDRRFAVDANNLASVIELCRRLDGVPLAIEMAAARLPALGLQALLQQLDRRLDLLHVAPRDGEARQRSLRELLDWSHTLLKPDEATVLRRLSVFAGSFGLAAAQRAAADDSLDRWDLVDALAGLVEQSLVKLEQLEPPRYRLLETTRVYAQERLVEAGEVAATRQRHMQAMVDGAERLLAAGTEPAADRAEPGSRADYDDLVLAFEYACQRGQGDAGAVLVVALRRIDQALGLLTASGHRVIAAVSLLPHAGLRGQALLHGFLASCGGAQAPGWSRVECARQAVALWRSLGDPRQLHGALGLLATESSRLDDFDAAEQALEEAAGLERADWPPQTLAGRLVHQGWVAAYRGDLERSRASLRQAVDLFDRCDDRRLGWGPRVWLAWASLSMGDTVEAIALCHDHQAEVGPPGTSGFDVFAGTVLAQALLMSGEPDAARQALASVWPDEQALDDQGLDMVEAAALWAAMTGDLCAAACLLGHAEAARRTGAFSNSRLDQQIRHRAQALVDIAASARQAQAWREAGEALTWRQVQARVRAMLASDRRTPGTDIRR